LLLTLLGCGSDGGPPRGTVTGTVTIDGQPLDVGSITFIPTGETKGPVAGGEIKDGVYMIANSVCVGTNRVEIRGRKKTGRTIRPIPPAPPDMVIDELVDATPARFNTESILTATINPGTNEVDFPLKADARAASN
jgi:hypothetical protein